jgi:hypothetical protein
LDDYPEHPTQAFRVEELEENLKDIFNMPRDGKPDAKKHGVNPAAHLSGLFTVSR